MRENSAPGLSSSSDVSAGEVAGAAGCPARAASGGGALAAAEAAAGAAAGGAAPLRLRRVMRKAETSSGRASPEPARSAGSCLAGAS